MQTAIDLRIFCNPDDRREALKSPFSDENYTYAADGHICIRVPRIPEIPENEGGVRLLKYLKFDHAEMTDWKPIQTEIPEGKRVDCMSCHGTGKVLICEDCDGDGEVEYEFFSKSGKSYDLDHECPVCEGRGKMNGDGTRCEDCAGQGFTIKNVPVKVTEIGLSISNHLLQRVRDLPGLEIAVKGRVDDMPPVRFRFDGGCGLIMPMRVTRGSGARTRQA